MSINNKIILIDPIFSSSASPFSWLIKRYQPPVFKLKELPKVDFILISHDHYDHLDMETILYFKNKNFPTPKDEVNLFFKTNFIFLLFLNIVIPSPNKFTLEYSKFNLPNKYSNKLIL